MHHYKIHFSDKNFITSFCIGFVLLGISLFMQFWASNYSTRASSGSVADIFLSNIPVYDVSGIFVWGAVLAVLISIFVLLKHINYAPFMMKSTAMFVIIRSVFVSLTHISPFPNHVLISSNFFSGTIFNGIFNGNDLFFSGHTGLPFLMALIFWENKILRFIFLGFSILMAIVVLLGHLHYSIDVLAAYFITYTIFQICKFIFPKDWALFQEKKF
ncbi:MAG: phosphatase PAP2-related protein [bacterium]